MDATASELHQAFVGAFGPYLNDVASELGTSLPADVVHEASMWFDRELRSLLELPFGEQRRSPLEIVQMATSGPNSALAGSGVRPPLRDPVTVAAVPGDTYGLAPASSAALGEEAFHAHLAWGVEKARALAPLVTGAGRTVVLVSGDLMDRSRFEDAINSAGLRLEMWGRDHDSELSPVLAFVDLTHSDAEIAIKALKPIAKVVAYGPHVDEGAVERAFLLGADTVLPRSRLFRAISEFLPKIV